MPRMVEAGFMSLVEVLQSRTPKSVQLRTSYANDSLHC